MFHSLEDCYYCHHTLENTMERKMLTYHTVFKGSKVTLLFCVSEEFDFSVCLAQGMSRMTGIGHVLHSCATV